MPSARERINHAHRDGGQKAFCPPSPPPFAFDRQTLLLSSPHDYRYSCTVTFELSSHTTKFASATCRVGFTSYLQCGCRWLTHSVPASFAVFCSIYVASTSRQVEFTSHLQVLNVAFTPKIYVAHATRCELSSKVTVGSYHGRLTCTYGCRDGKNDV